jgi:NADP-dependent aldehyde dehydrogenase
MMAVRQVLLDGCWRDADATSVFQAENPATCQPLPDEYPVSSWTDCETALQASYAAFAALRGMSGDRMAAFLERYADRIEARKSDLVETAHAETALPAAPRLADVELPRTTGQLRAAAAAARDGSWSLATIDTATGIRSHYAALGPVCVFGPNNFPFAFGSISGGDFAAAIAAGNPVIAKANSSHPGTTRVFAEEAQLACEETGLPPATVQLLYRTSHPDGERLVSDPRVGATGYTGSRSAGLALKAAADDAGKPIYLELSSVNPIVVLPGAIRQRGEQLVDEFTTSCLMGTGQFCTNPGMVILLDNAESEAFIRHSVQRFETATAGTLLSKAVLSSLDAGLQILQQAGAELVTGTGTPGQGYSRANTLLKVAGDRFLGNSAALQTEAFGNCSLLVLAADVPQLAAIIDQLEGNLTGCIYSDTGGSDDEVYDHIAPRLRQRVGRLLNDKMPTGVSVSPAMNHGGPYPATGHPGFTAVGIPASLLRFAMLQCYDNVRPHRLPNGLQDQSPNDTMWRSIDGCWTRDDVE